MIIRRRFSVGRTDVIDDFYITLERPGPMSSPVVLPELGTKSELCVSSWLVDLGDHVHVGDRVVEVLMRGITFQVAATATGILTGIAKPEQSTVRAGDTLGWIEPDETGGDPSKEESE